ncbi:Purine-cytosine permease [Microbacterium sp. cf046]|uniref:purine-cytosine permease family protein n=1 Tax=Microbacterium sp. cf046 TaxID=1761803 RepID=UPI0008E016E7|nr:cytosine permease [Microbacterium sp. cf046]SFS14820.1 Purine-cytosine permease [Microbacterium sp. cf046]
MTITAQHAAESSQPGDVAGHIETRGIDYIPSGERHGRPSALFGIWAAANVLYLNFVFGGILILLGLGLWESLVICVLGNLWWFVIGWIAISGPASGTPSVMIMRAMFGVRGNALFGSGLGVLIGLFYIVLNVAFTTLASEALLASVGITLPDGFSILLLVAVSALSLLVSVFGHATIEKLSTYLSIAVGACFAAVGVFVLAAADWSYSPAALPAGENIALLLLGLTVVASGPLSWGTSADYSRYLPTRTSKRSIILFTALGGFVPSVLIAGLGVIAGTSIDMTDPQTAIAEILPSWLYPVFLLAIIVGTLANNVLCSYSTGLYAQAFIPRVRRAVSVMIVGVVAAVLAAYLLYGAPRFLDTLSYAIEIAVAVMGPLVAIYAIDIVLRRGRYDGLTLNDTSRRSPFWYTGGWFLPGTVAMVVATTVAVLMVNTTLYTGPISAALGGADLSSLVGPALAAGLYALLWRTTRPYRDPAARPSLDWTTAQDTGAPVHRTHQDESIAAFGEAMRSGR